MTTKNSAYLVGKERTLGGGQRSWRAALYAPSNSRPYWWVKFRELQDGKWVMTTRNAADETEGRKKLAEAEAYLDGAGHAPVRSDEAAQRTMSALGVEYIAESRRQNKEPRTVEGRESKLRAHIQPTIGDIPAADWRLKHTEAVFAHARKTVRSHAGLQDIRQTLSAMRGLAWRLGWLSRAVDPLDGLQLPKASTYHGVQGYVPPSERPEHHQVDAMARAADLMTGTGPLADQEVEPVLTLKRLPLFGEKIRLAGYGGLRLGEQHGLRAIDIDFARGVVTVNGAWVQPRSEDAPQYRGPVKNRRLHDVPMPASWLGRMLPHAAVALGLPTTATKQQVINAQQAEIRRRRLLAADEPGHDLHWWNWPGSTPQAWKSHDARSEPWLFIDTETGVPPRSELHNDRWHKVLRNVRRTDPENEWPKHITYRNLRHHAATFWHDELGRDWVDVAAFLGDELKTVLEHYVLPSDRALEETIRQLANL